MPVRSIVLVDFDGTLLSVNSFPLWVRFLILRSASRLRFLLLMRLSADIFQRKLRGLSHALFKQKLSELNYPAKWDRDFTFSLGRYVRWKLVKSIEKHNHAIVISTAAPWRYAQFLPDLLGTRFATVIASGPSGNGFRDNAASQKVESLTKHFNGHRFSIVALYTDHHDDLPLAERARKVFLVEPSDITIKRMKTTNATVLRGLDVAYPAEHQT